MSLVVPSYMQQFYKSVMHLLNLLKNHIVHYMFRPSLVIIKCYKIVLWRLLCLLFSSTVGSEAPSHIRVFRGAACFLLPRCVFRPRVCDGAFLQKCCVYDGTTRDKSG
jgi:hypothetical protein